MLGQLFEGHSSLKLVKNLCFTCCVDMRSKSRFKKRFVTFNHSTIKNTSLNPNFITIWYNVSVSPCLNERKERLKQIKNMMSVLGSVEKILTDRIRSDSFSVVIRFSINSAAKNMGPSVVCFCKPLSSSFYYFGWHLLDSNLLFLCQFLDIFL